MSHSPSMTFLHYMSISRSLSLPEGLFAHSAWVTPPSDWHGGVVRVRGAGVASGLCGGNPCYLISAAVVESSAERLIR